MKKFIKYTAAALFFVAGMAGYYAFTQPGRASLVVHVEAGREIFPQAPALPDISRYTSAAIIHAAPPFRAGNVVMANMDDFPAFSEFLEGDAARHLRLLQHRIHPRAIVITEGDYDFEKLYEAVSASNLIRKEGNIYLLQAPLLVAENASLVIPGSQVSELRLLKQANTFIANSGRLFILNTKVTGWDEVAQKPSEFKKDRDFRPFITSWDGSKMFIASSRLASLGYLKGKSYGLSYSTCTACLKKDANLPRPTGVIAGSHFSDMYYGFYCYEADDVAVVGNTYADNIIYGIDPHDRSRRLIIAGNEVYGSRKKHGIIISREVNHSWIFNNHTHHNHGSGVMVDRSSTHNVIAANDIHDNAQDGISVFESQDNIFWGNRIMKNKKNGARIRNSWGVRFYNDRFAMNEAAAVEAYAVDIGGQKSRDFQLDPFTKRADVALYGAMIHANGTSVFKVNNIDHMILQNVQISSGTNLFPKTLQYDENALLKMLETKDRTIRVELP